MVYIPACVEADDHLKCSDSRTFGRFPTLAYFNRQLGYSIWRSSAQSFDTTTKRQVDDEKFLASLNKNVDNPKQNLFIFNHFDIKAPRTSYENEVYYQGSRSICYKLNQAREVSQSFDTLWEACQSFTELKSKFIK